MMITGLQAAFLLFHNHAVDVVRDNDRQSPEEVFDRARQLTTWHYQWMVVHEFLPLFIGQAMVDDILGDGRRFYRPRGRAIPVEFQGAAYRFGHTMVRPSYRANLAGDNGQPFFGMVFDPTPRARPIPVTSEVALREPRRFIGWQTFFDFGAIPRPSGRRHARRGRAPEQAHRLRDLHAPLQPAAADDRLRHAAHVAAPAQPTSPGHVGHPLRPEHRPDHGGAGARQQI